MIFESIFLKLKITNIVQANA